MTTAEKKERAEKLMLAAADKYEKASRLIGDAAKLENMAYHDLGLSELMKWKEDEHE